MEALCAFTVQLKSVQPGIVREGLAAAKTSAAEGGQPLSTSLDPAAGDRRDVRLRIMHNGKRMLR